MKAENTWYAMQAAADGETASIDIFDEIGGYGVSAGQFIKALKDLGAVKHIALNILSPGGSIIEGHAIYNAIRKHPATVAAHIDFAASMAGVVAMAADRVTIAENGWFMLHNPWTLSMGDAAQLRKDADLLDRMREMLLTAYSRSGLPREELLAMMEAETWLTGADAVALGFADELTPKIAAAASMRPGPLATFPAEALEWVDVAGAEITVTDDEDEPGEAAPADTADPAEPENMEGENASDTASDPESSGADDADDGPAQPVASGRDALGAIDAAYEEGLSAGRQEAEQKFADKLTAQLEARTAELRAALAETRAALEALETLHAEAVETLVAERDLAIADAEKVRAEHDKVTGQLYDRLNAVRAGFRTPDVDPPADGPHPFERMVQEIMAEEKRDYNAALAAATQRFPEMHAAYIRAANEKNKHRDVTAA